MITRNFNLYLNAGHSVPLVINVNQYDRGEQWVFTLYNSDGTQYTPSSGAIVGIKSDGLGIINSGSVVGGKVVISETQQMTAAVGKAVFELMIDDQTHGTANFIVLVEEKPGNNADLSESDLSLIQQAIDGTSATAIAQSVADWMDDNLTPTTPVVDASLTVSGAAADAAVTGALIRGGGSGLTNEAKQALLACFQNVAWIDEHGQDYYDALESALYPPANLAYITAVYTQRRSVYDTDSLDVLKSDLVVTAKYSDASSETITSYTLSGTLTEGTSTVTVAYGGKTTTFNVTVTAAPNWSISNSLTNVSNSNNATQITHGSPYSATLTPSTGYYIASITITMGGTDVTSLYYADGSINIGAVTGNVVITAVGQLEPETGLVYSNSEPIVTNGATLVDTGFAPADGAFTIMCEWSDPTFSNGATLFSLYQSTTGSNHTVVAVTMGYPSITYAAQSYSHGNTLSDLKQTPLRVVVTKGAGNSTPVWYYKDTNGNLATKTTSNNPVTPTGNIFIGGNATSNDGSTAANYAKATFNTFKCYNVVCNENKIKGFLEVE